MICNYEFIVFDSVLLEGQNRRVKNPKKNFSILVICGRYFHKLIKAEPLTLNLSFGNDCINILITESCTTK